MKNITPIGATLTTALKTAGYAAAEVCRQIGMSPTQFSKIKLGREKLPMRFVDDLCTVLPCINKDYLTKAVRAQ